MNKHVDITIENEKECRMVRFCDMYPKLLNKVGDDKTNVYENEYTLTKEEQSTYNFILEAIRPLRKTYIE